MIIVKKEVKKQKKNYTPNSDTKKMSEYNNSLDCDRFLCMHVRMCIQKKE